MDLALIPKGSCWTRNLHTHHTLAAWRLRKNITRVKKVLLVIVVALAMKRRLALVVADVMILKKIQTLGPRYVISTNVRGMRPLTNLGQVLLSKDLFQIIERNVESLDCDASTIVNFDRVVV